MQVMNDAVPQKEMAAGCGIEFMTLNLLGLSILEMDCNGGLV